MRVLDNPSQSKTTVLISELVTITLGAVILTILIGFLVNGGFIFV